jgi:hypothetical protein
MLLSIFFRGSFSDSAPYYTHVCNIHIYHFIGPSTKRVEFFSGRDITLQNAEKYILGCLTIEWIMINRSMDAVLYVLCAIAYCATIILYFILSHSQSGRFGGRRIWQPSRAAYHHDDTVTIIQVVCVMWRHNIEVRVHCHYHNCSVILYDFPYTWLLQ